MKTRGLCLASSQGTMPWTAKFIEYFNQDTVQMSVTIAKQDLRIKPNLLLEKQKVIRTALNRNVEFNHSTKNFGPVLYSRDIYLEQCKKHLYYGKRKYTAKPNNMILHSVSRRLKDLLNDCFGQESATKSLLIHSQNG
jgi:hypothetical protein